MFENANAVNIYGDSLIHLEQQKFTLVMKQPRLVKIDTACQQDHRHDGRGEQDHAIVSRHNGSLRRHRQRPHGEKRYVLTVRYSNIFCS